MVKRDARPYISGELRSRFESSLPKLDLQKAAGRPRVPDRQVLCGILFVLCTGIQCQAQAKTFRSIILLIIGKGGK
ncbi:hypothetical protein AB0933_00215 [Streptomyces venezuelae]|uniref:hypothetical protein n=1 Tax=Streptomyces venezuelae TaxID=54571 RepID=UPI003456B3AF